MKQTIEEAAIEYMSSIQPKMSWFRDDFIAGAKSQAAKDFHTQGMYSKDDMISFGVFYYEHQGKGDEYLGQDLFKVWKEKNGKS